MVTVLVTSSGTIQPSSPTPDRVRNCKLSLLDAVAPAMYVPQVLFFPSGAGGRAERAAKTTKLKRSLSETLTRYFPLAGRIKPDENSVDCDDQGADFFEAEVAMQLSEFLRLPDMEEQLHLLLPCNLTTAKSGRENVCLGIQVNHFQCGAMAVGVSISHAVADLGAMAAFLNSWGAAARGGSGQILPLSFVGASLFPFQDVPRFPTVAMENASTRRFIFSAASVVALRAHSAAVSRFGAPTRVEAVAALVWRAVIRATHKEGRARALVTNGPVNIRQRTHPPLAEDSFGNLFVVVSTDGVLESDLYEGCLEEQLRKAFRSADLDHIRELQGPNAAAKAWEFATKLVGKFPDVEVEWFPITSWCRFPIYEVDFGWGTPLWVSSASVPLKNLMILVDRKGDEGVEVWANMEKEDMARLEKDEELLSYASFPSIL